MTGTYPERIVAALKAAGKPLRLRDLSERLAIPINTLKKAIKEEPSRHRPRWTIDNKDRVRIV